MGTAKRRRTHEGTSEARTYEIRVTRSRKTEKHWVRATTVEGAARKFARIVQGCRGGIRAPRDIAIRQTGEEGGPGYFQAFERDADGFLAADGLAFKVRAFKAL